MRRFLLCALGALAGCAAPPPSDDAPILPLAVDRGWIRDATGRVTLLRGLNYSALEFGNFIGAEHGPAEADLAQTAAWGFNTLRLTISWQNLEPEPGAPSEAHLVEQVDPIVQWAADHGLVVLLNLHQYHWSRCVGGNGVPEWSCPGYAQDITGYLAASCDFFKGRLGPTGRPLTAHLADVWALIAAHYAGDARVAGFDLFNEPPNIGCMDPDDFAADAVYPMYRELIAAIRGAGAEQIILVEPDLLRGAGARFPAGDVGDVNAVYAPHLYSAEVLSLPGRSYSGDREHVDDDHDLAVAEAQDLGLPLWVGEFGGDTSPEHLAANEAFLRDSFAALDRTLSGGAVWAYFPSDNVFSVVDAEGGPKGTMDATLSRPYPQQVAGEPTRIEFDPTSADFTFEWRGDVGGGQTASRVWLPLAEHYPGGVAVEASPGVQWELAAAEGLLRVWAAGEGPHQLRVRRAP